MTKTQQDRKDRLMPNGIPRWIRCWDSGPHGAIDRYTVVYSGRYPKGEGRDRRYQYVAMSVDPMNPQGVGQHGETQDIIDCPYGWTEQIGRTCRHNPTLGRRIAFQDLPANCRELVLSDYHELWSIPLPAAFFADGSEPGGFDASNYFGYVYNWSSPCKRTNQQAGWFRGDKVMTLMSSEKTGSSACEKELTKSLTNCNSSGKLWAGE